MAYPQRILRSLIAFLLAIFNICAALALFFGLYIGYTQPNNNPDPGSRIADSATHAAKESVEVVEKVGKWFADEISYDSLSHSNPRVTRVLILIPKLLIYYPSWAGAGFGGAVGGVIGDVVWHVMHRAAQTAPAAPPVTTKS